MSNKEYIKYQHVEKLGSDDVDRIMKGTPRVGDDLALVDVKYLLKAMAQQLPGQSINSHRGIQ